MTEATHSEVELHRALGNIEGAQEQILIAQDKTLKALEKLGERFAEHLQADQIEFSASRNLAYKLRDELKLQFEAQTKSRDEHLDAQDVKLTSLVTARAVLFGQLTMGQKLIAYVGAFALFCITAYDAWKRFAH